MLDCFIQHHPHSGSSSVCVNLHIMLPSTNSLSWRARRLFSFSENLPVSINCDFFFFFFFCLLFSFYFLFLLRILFTIASISVWDLYFWLVWVARIQLSKNPQIIHFGSEECKKKCFGVDGNSVCHKRLSVLAAYGQITSPTSKNAPFINPLQCQNLNGEVVIAPTYLCMINVFKKTLGFFFGLLFMKFLFNQ